MEFTEERFWFLLDHQRKKLQPLRLDHKRGFYLVFLCLVIVSLTLLRLIVDVEFTTQSVKSVVGVSVHVEK